MHPTTYGRPHLLAEPDWLDSHRDDPAVCLVDCSHTHGPKWAYIPGAVELSAHFALKDPADPVHVIGAAPFAALMGRMGVDEETTVVAYDRHGGMAAARLWWVLRYYGHGAAGLLNGGWHRWMAEGRSITLKPRPRAPARFESHPDDAVLARKDYVRARMDAPDARILDVRLASERSEANPWGNARAGQIPGAAHWEWINSLSADERRMFRPAAELREGLAAVGVTPAKEVITHCQAGIRASHGAFVLNLLGYERVRNYEASMKEWANAPDTPLESAAPLANLPGSGGIR
jgi:thiosulfate/3-mercaptopyruvate sulfurtransferase